MKVSGTAVLLVLFLLFSTPANGAVESTLLSQGDTGSNVQQFQSELKELGFMHSSVDGIYGPKTEEAVLNFQKAASITVDGIFGPETGQALERAAGRTRELEILSSGTHAPEVIFLQQQLAVRGLYAGEIDGKFGPVTRQAVVSFQERNGLTADGIVGPKTWNALENNNPAAENPANKRPVLHDGHTGQEVKRLQEFLSKMGFMPGEPDGIFGLQTKLAVKKAQHFFQISIDGIAGPETWGALEEGKTGSAYRVQAGDSIWQLAQKWNTSVEEITRANKLASSRSLQQGNKLQVPNQAQPQKVKEVEWSRMHNLLPPRTKAIVTDVETGLSFRVRRLGGTNHADVEPLTIRDTQALNRIYNGNWSWERRAVVVQVNDKVAAGSINGYPHGSQSIKDNGFDGHICLHFSESRLHTNNTRDEEHQDSVEEAASNPWPLNSSTAP